MISMFCCVAQSIDSITDIEARAFVQRYGSTKEESR